MTDQHPLTEWQQFKEHLKNFPDLEQSFFEELVSELKKQHDEQIISILYDTFTRSNQSTGGI